MFGSIDMTGFKLRRRYLPYASFCEVVKSPEDFEYLAYNITFDVTCRYSMIPDELIEWFEDWIKKHNETFDSFWTVQTEIGPNNNSYSQVCEAKITIIFASEEDLKKVESILVKDKLSGDIE